MAEQNVSLSSLQLVGYWIDFTMMEFILSHPLETMKVSGRFRYKSSIPSQEELKLKLRLVSTRTDFDTIKAVLRLIVIKLKDTFETKMAYKLDFEPFDKNSMARKLSYKYVFEKKKNFHKQIVFYL